MIKNAKNQISANNSNAILTPTERNAVPYYSRYLIERNAKNQAYYFILSNGLYKQFEDFLQSVKVNDFNAAFLSIFKDKIKDG